MLKLNQNTWYFENIDPQGGVLLEFSGCLPPITGVLSCYFPFHYSQQ